MSQRANKKAEPASKSAKKPSKEKRPARSENRNGDSDDIERAVYDGMQDLRTPKRK